ncbi:MAG: DUF3187 family protein, partial [Oligoflexia bacterium]|nr:DUF3187 family protein [Oligoflexia bacterium]
MKHLCFFSILLFLNQSFAGLSPVHSYPPAIMHQLPSGERPGWEKPLWFNLDVQQANFWNLPTRFTHNESGKDLFYFNDFEQTTIITELGFQVAPQSAIAVELPVVLRSGGAFDHFINEFHNVFGFINFNRNMYPEFQNQLNIRVNGVDAIPVQASGMGNIKIKYKNWFAKNSNCATCGWALNFQVKIPLENGLRGLSSGYYDGSLLLHAGFMLSKGFNVYLSTGVTTTLNNKAFEQWPINKLQFLSDISTEITFTKDWELIFSASLYSPYMNKNLLTYYD